MNISIINELLSFGITQDISPGGRFQAIDTEHFWYVEEGCVDIFLSPIENTFSQTNNKLIPFHRIEKGQIFIGVDNIIKRKWSLVARICSNTTVKKFPRKIYANFSQELQLFLSKQIDEFILSLTKSNIYETFPHQYIDLQSVNVSSLKKDDAVTSLKGVTWFGTQENNFFFVSDQGMSIDKMLFIPLTPYSWVEIAQDTTFTQATTSELMNNKFSWDSLQCYFLMIIYLKIIHIETEDLFDNVILFNKIENNQFSIKQSLDFLSHSFRGESKNVLTYEKFDAPLYQACVSIATYLNIELKLPSENMNLFGKDDFKNLMAYSKIFYRKISLDDKWYQQNHHPLLAYYASIHEPVAVIPQHADSNWLYEPNLPPKKITKKIANTLENKAYILYQKFEEKVLRLKDILKIGIQRSYSNLLIILTCGLAIALLGILFPILTQFIFDSVIIINEKNQLFQIFLILSAITLAISFLEFTKHCMLLNLESYLDCLVNAVFWSRILKLPVNFFKKHSAGELASRVCNLIEIRQYLTGITFNIMFDSLFSITSILLLFYYQAKLAAVILLSLSTLAVFYFFLTKKRLHFENLMVLKNAKIFGMLSEFFRSITKIRLAGAEYRVFLNWAHEFSLMQAMLNKAQKIEVLSKSIIEVIPILSVSVMYLGIILLFNTQSIFTTGSFLAFNIALGQVLVSLSSLIEEINRISSIAPLFDKTRIFIETHPEVAENKIDPGTLKGEIELSHVSFKYPDSDAKILKDINFTIGAGKYVAIVGKSGAGKSTLLRMLLGFEAPTGGRIYYDNKDLSTLDNDLLRKQIGVVLQHDELIPGNIYSNISGLSDLSIEETWEIAYKAGIADDILAMPMQMNTIINLEGSGLSGGQKQRLLIARAIARAPKILILDEATRALDNITQKIVIDNLGNMRITRIVVAHRLSTLLKVDKIFVLDDGYITEAGSYEELLEKQGTFYKLVQKQLIL